jgi:hypothetical protein
MGKTIVKSRRFYTFWMKGGKTMLNMLLAVVVWSCQDFFAL